MSLRAMRTGDAFDVDMKLQKRYDQEDKLGTPQKIVEWIVQVVGTTDGLPASRVYDWRAIHAFLKDGVIVCKLINKLLKQIGQPTVHYRPKAPSSFVAMSNIDTFVSAAKTYGVPEMSLFQSADLFEGRKGPLLYVINCLNQLATLANARGFTPKYVGVAPPKPDWALETDD